VETTSGTTALDEGEGGHQDRPQPQPRCLDRGGDGGLAVLLDLVREQTLLDQLRALAADDPDFFTNLTEQKPAA
jgi:hypothetical protein